MKYKGKIKSSQKLYPRPQRIKSKWIKSSPLYHFKIIIIFTSILQRFYRSLYHHLSQNYFSISTRACVRKKRWVWNSRVRMSKTAASRTLRGGAFGALQYCIELCFLVNICFPWSRPHPKCNEGRRNGMFTKSSPTCCLEVDFIVRCRDSVPVGQFGRMTRSCSSFVHSVTLPVQRHSVVNHVTNSSQLLVLKRSR